MIGHHLDEEIARLDLVIVQLADSMVANKARRTFLNERLEILESTVLELERIVDYASRQQEKIRDAHAPIPHRDFYGNRRRKVEGHLNSAGGSLFHRYQIHESRLERVRGRISTLSAERNQLNNVIIPRQVTDLENYEAERIRLRIERSTTAPLLGP